MSGGFFKARITGEMGKPQINSFQPGVLFMGHRQTV